jgi:hypothetical protein
MRRAAARPRAAAPPPDGAPTPPPPRLPPDPEARFRRVWGSVGGQSYTLSPSTDSWLAAAPRVRVRNASDRQV